MKTIVLFISFIFSFSLFAQDYSKVNLNEYLEEVQIWNREGETEALTFWIPTSYWRIALQNSPDVTEEVITQIEDNFKDYVFICTLNFNMTDDLSFEFTEEEEMRRSISLVDSIGNKHKPLRPNEVSPMAIYLSESIKPMFDQMLGKMGEGMYFYFFKVEDSEGNKLVNEFEKVILQ